MRALVCLFVCIAASVSFGVRAHAGPLYTARDCTKLDTQAEMNICAGKNEAAADAALNQLYRKLMAAQSGEAAKARLRDAERAWVAYRDGECRFDVGPREEGGSIWPLAWSTCLRDKTDARLRELQHHLDCPSALACPAGK
jgi:uncharacterized protein YecT (DUF1311 family)